MIYQHKHMKMQARKEWHSGVTIYRWFCPYCHAEGADMEEWKEPEGIYFGIPLLDHISTCDVVINEKEETR